MSEENNDNRKVTLRVKYEKSEAIFASQAMVQQTAEEVFIDFSSGVVSSGGEDRVMPIHTRIAMTKTGAQRLLAALNRTLNQQETAAAPEKKER